MRVAARDRRKYETARALSLRTYHLFDDRHHNIRHGGTGALAEVRRLDDDRLRLDGPQNLFGEDAVEVSIEVVALHNHAYS